MKTVGILLLSIFLATSGLKQFPAQAESFPDSCLLLDSNSYIEFDRKIINVEGPFTVEFWVNQQWDMPFVTEVISQGSQPYAFYIGPTEDGTLRAGDGWIDTGTKLELQVWTHLAVTRSQDGVGRLYKNGVLVASNSAYTVKNGTWNTRIGAQFGAYAGERFAGCVDELRIWNYERSVNQIVSFKERNSIQSDNGLIYWNMNRDDVSFVAADYGLSNKISYVKVGDPRLVRVTSAAFDRSGMLADRPKLIDYPLCSKPAKSPCIESLELIKKDGSIISAIPITKRRTTYNFAGLMSDSVEVYQWRTPGVLHENGKDLLDLDVYRFPIGAPYCWDVGKCSNSVDEIVIYMYGGTRGLPAKKIEFPGLPNDKLCGDLNSPTECFRAWGLNPEYRYRVTLLVEKDFDFSHSNGEARDGSLGVTKLSSGEKRLRFSGSPVTFSTVVKTPLRPDVTVDKADSSHNYIGVYAHSTNSGQSQWLARCDYGRGMSLWYSGVLQSMPTWIAEESSLSLSVSSTHFRADGSKNLGTFNIEMPIKTAQCLWGVDLSRATQAVVSTVYPELDKQEIVTTSALVQGDFYKVSASGFHFSSPTIKVKVTQEDRTVSGKSSTDGSTKASSGAKTSSKKLQIICTKGKVRKIVIARNPSCPQGYQRTK